MECNIIMKRLNMQFASMILILLLSTSLVIPTIALAKITDTPSGKSHNSPEILKNKNAWEISAFKLKGIDNKTHSLDEWKGKVILLNFWASWCSPCIREIKDFIKYQKHFEGDNFQLVSIGVDNEEELRKLSKSMKINYPVLFADSKQDYTKKILAQWGNPKGLVPYTIIINKQGNIHFIHHGKFDEGLFNYYVVPLFSL